MNKKDGFMKLVLIIIIGIIILSYLGFDLRKIIEAPQTQDNLGYVWGIVTNFWNTYLSEPLNNFWQAITSTLKKSI